MDKAGVDTPKRGTKSEEEVGGGGPIKKIKILISNPDIRSKM
jgi:hypothetical protein